MKEKKYLGTNISKTAFSSKKLSACLKKGWTRNCALVTNVKINMSLLLPVRERLLLTVIFMALPLVVWGQPVTVPQGNQTSIAGPLNGDQVQSSIALNANGGFIVWEENGNAKTGSQISGARLNSSGTQGSSFLINKIAKGNQLKPDAQLLTDGSAIVVWQGDGLKTFDIYARILKEDGSFLTSDVRVNSYTKDQQSSAAVAASADGGAWVAWQSYGQDGSMYGVFARKISASGAVGKSEFQVNQATSFNQRSPALAALKNGNVVVVWISEQERFRTSVNSPGSVDVYARIFSDAGDPVSNEILLNAGNNICANPSIAALASGGFTVVWSEKDAQGRPNGWEVLGRSFSAEGVAAGGDFKINTHTYGDQYRPKIAAVGNDCAVVWSSLGQDGSWEGVFGSLLQGGTVPTGTEFRANSTTVSRQIHPAISSVGADRFFVSWSSFVETTGLDLFGRRYIVNQQP